MAVAEIHFTAKNALGRMHAMNVILPEKMEGPFPVLYLLHGMSDDHTAWTRRSNVERYAEQYPLIIVMPNTERGWYSDALDDPSKQFESYIIKDLIAYVDSTFQTVASREGRAIMGLSMGGYGAIKLAMRHPELFAMAHGFSSGLDYGRGYRGDMPEMKLIFGDNPKGGDFDLCAYAEKVDKKTLPAISFDTGVDDFVLESNRAFDKRLTELGIPHKYTEYSGDHNWDYWDEHVKMELPNVMSVIGRDTVNPSL